MVDVTLEAICYLRHLHLEMEAHVAILLQPLPFTLLLQTDWGCSPLVLSLPNHFCPWVPPSQ